MFAEQPAMIDRMDPDCNADRKESLIALGSHRFKWQRSPGVLALSLLTIHAVISVLSLHQQSVTMDEYGHLPAGLSYWHTGSFRVYRVNPPLTKLLAALPVLAGRPNTISDPVAVVASEDFSVFGRFMYANADRYFQLFFLGRYPIVALTFLAGWFVYRLSGEIYGPCSALLAVSLWVTCPTIMAHGQLITADMGATVGILATTWFAWQWWQKPTWGRCAALGFVLGLAELTKFTCLVLYAVGALLLAMECFRWGPFVGRRRADKDRSLPQVAGETNDVQSPLVRGGWLRLGVQVVCIVFGSVFMINAGYLFEGSFQRLGHFEFRSAPLNAEHLLALGDQGEVHGLRMTRYELVRENRWKRSILAELPVPLPEHYVLGIDDQTYDFEHPGWFPSYKGGELRYGGWWYFYLYALGVKLPLGTIALCILTVLMTMVAPRTYAPRPREWGVLLPGIGVLALVSSQTGFTIHLRYVLPFFPFLFIGLSRLGLGLESQPNKTAGEIGCRPAMQGNPWLLPVLVGACLLWNLGAMIRIHPHYLSYFNELVGGPEHGERVLFDSNLDWGQDLLFLRNWLQEHPEARPLGLAYFTHVDPAIAGIEYQPPPYWSATPEEDGQTTAPQPGWYAVSVNFLIPGTSWSMRDGQGGHNRVPPGALDYFRYFEPVARAGYSIRIYHITREQANEVRRRFGLRLLGNEE